MINYNIIDELIEIDVNETPVMAVSDLESENKKLTILLEEACDLLRKVYIPKEAFSDRLLDWFNYYTLSENKAVKKFADRLSKK